MEKKNERPLEAINMDNLDVERAIKLLEDAIFLNGMPMWIPAHNSARVFEIEFIWLRPQTLKDALHIKEARKPIMYA